MCACLHVCIYVCVMCECTCVFILHKYVCVYECVCVFVCMYNPMPAIQEKPNLDNKNTLIVMGKNEKSPLGLGLICIALRRESW